MKAKLICEIIIILALLIRNNCFGQNQISDVHTPESILTNELPVWMAEFNVPCVGVGLIEEGKLKWVKVFGKLRKNTPAPENTLFNIASQTKPVVAMLTLTLVQANQWNLDEPLSHYWIDPDIAKDPYLEKLTTRHVLSHQTGFSNWRSDEVTQTLKFNFEPGTKFGYSGEGFAYLKQALENKFKQSLDKLLDSLLCTPLGLKDNRYWGKGMDTSRFARWHDGQGKEYAVSSETPVSAADDLITSVADYCKIGLFAMNGANLSPRLFSDMIKPQVKIKEHYYRGLGWGLVQGLPNGEYALEHGGSDLGVRTMAIFLPKSKKGIVVMTNGDNGIFVYEKIIKKVLASGPEILAIMSKDSSAHKRVIISDSLIQSYAGIYSQGNGKIMNVVQEGNAIKVSGDGLPTAVLFPESKNRFFLPNHDVQLEFPAPDSLVIFENGKEVMRVKKLAKQ